MKVEMCTRVEYMYFLNAQVFMEWYLFKDRDNFAFLLSSFAHLI
jgi:hypothetical protein